MAAQSAPIENFIPFIDSIFLKLCVISYTVNNELERQTAPVIHIITAKVQINFIFIRNISLNLRILHIKSRIWSVQLSGE